MAEFNSREKVAPLVRGKFTHWCIGNTVIANKNRIVPPSYCDTRTAFAGAGARQSRSPRADAYVDMKFLSLAVIQISRCGRELNATIAFPHFCYMVNRVTWTQGRVAQVLNSLAIAIHLGFALQIVITRQALHEYDW